jgi:hypothetical protein
MPRIHARKHSGVVVLWRYTDNDRNYRGWHLTADGAGCVSLLALLDAFAADRVAGSRTVRISRPTASVLAVPNQRPSQWVSPSKLRLTFSLTPSEWRFPASADQAELVIGADWLPKLRRGVADIANGQGDYRIGVLDDGSLPLWFWWWPSDS